MIRQIKNDRERRERKRVKERECERQRQTERKKIKVPKSVHDLQRHPFLMVLSKYPLSKEMC